MPMAKEGRQPDRLARPPPLRKLRVRVLGTKGSQPRLCFPTPTSPPIHLGLPICQRPGIPKGTLANMPVPVAAKGESRLPPVRCCLCSHTPVCPAPCVANHDAQPDEVARTRERRASTHHNFLGLPQQCQGPRLCLVLAFLSTIEIQKNLPPCITYQAVHLLPARSSLFPRSCSHATC
jgi:hypothetical protein